MAPKHPMSIIPGIKLDTHDYKNQIPGFDT
jgi:hypothetical protein